MGGSGTATLGGPWNECKIVEQKAPVKLQGVGLERPQKAQHCRELAITHFIDDRWHVLEHLEGVVRHRYLFGLQRKLRSMSGVVAMPTRKGVRPALLGGQAAAWAACKTSRRLRQLRP